MLSYNDKTMIVIKRISVDAIVNFKLIQHLHSPAVAGNSKIHLTSLAKWVSKLIRNQSTVMKLNAE